MQLISNGPSAQFRPIPFYFINRKYSDDLSPEAIDAAMINLRDAGFGGCVLFNKPPDGFTHDEYLGEEWFAMVTCFAESARRLELQLWINDGYDFPPGDAGGRLQKLAPHLCQKRFKRRVDGTFEVVKVPWGFPAFEEPASSELFIQLVYEQYKRRVGEYFGNGIEGFFSDADCRRFGPFPMDCERYFPASGDMPKLFQEAYGDELWPHLDDIWHDRPTPARATYWALAAKLYRQWFRNNYDWCRRHNLKYTFHTSDTGPYTFQACPRSSIFTEGDFLSLAACCDYPGTDHELSALNGGRHFHPQFYYPRTVWGGDAKESRYSDFNDTHGDVRAKYAASAAFMHGKERVVCEAFAATNWGVRFEELRRIAAWQIMQGINFFVPHAVHHRLHGKTKYFAPPALTAPGALREGMGEFNHWLAKWCRNASLGEPVYEIALIDPTRKMWRGESNGRALFALCEKLNRLPWGYVIVSEEYACKHANDFHLVLDPDEEFEFPVSCLSDDLQFTGNGEVHFMRRRRPDGCEFVLVANVWNDAAIRGKLRFKKQQWALEVQPGEIALLGEDMHDYRPLSSGKAAGIMLPDWDVTWLQPNVIPLSSWLDADGQVKHCSQAGETEPLFVEWSNRQNLPDLQLWLPAELYSRRAEFSFNGQLLPDGQAVQQFDDCYYSIELAGSGPIGTHTLQRAGANEEKDVNMIFLKGEFDLEIVTTGEMDIPYRQTYCLKQHLPVKMKLSLSRRSQRLSCGPWSEQGHPFYSGGAIYATTLQQGAKLAYTQLLLPSVAEVAEVCCNGINLGRTIWNGVHFDLPAAAHELHLQVTVWNTLGNMMEEYAAAGGLLEAPALLFA